MAVVRHKEAIHSGHFMISNFEAEAEDEEDMAVPPPEEGSNLSALPMDNQMVRAAAEEDEETESIQPEVELLQEETEGEKEIKMGCIRGGHEAVIDLSLNRLFRSMSIAYRHKLTSPKWNRFRGLRLRWKDKIRLNNVIWRCWHMQFIKGNSKLLCAFANPLEIDNHNRTEGSTLLEGKYWKRKMNTVTQQYMKWRLFYKNRGSTTPDQEVHEEPPWDVILQDNWQPTQSLGGSKDDVALHLMEEHEDFLFEAIFGKSFNGADSTNGGKNQGGSVAGIQFPNPREIQKSTTNADFIQPGLVQLQPNLDDLFMDFETPPDWLTSKLPIIPEGAEDASIGSSGSSNFVGQRQLPVASKGKTVPAVAATPVELEASSSYSGPQQGVNQLQQQQQQQQQQQPQPVLPPEPTQGVSGGSYPLDLQVPQNAGDILPRSPTTSSDFMQGAQQQPLAMGQQQQHTATAGAATATHQPGHGHGSGFCRGGDTAAAKPAAAATATSAAAKTATTVWRYATGGQLAVSEL